MGDKQVIMRTERRRKWTDDERAQILADCNRPGVTIREVARRHEVAESLVYGWRAAMRKQTSLSAEPMNFISYGEIAAAPAESTVPIMAERQPASISEVVPPS